MLWLTRISCSIRAATHGRSTLASSGVSRWMVPRIVRSRTRLRFSSSPLRSCGSKV